MKNYIQTIKYLYDALPVFHRIGQAAYKANLNNSLTLDKLLDHPHKKYRTVHVAGTNGKGSVSHIIAAALNAAGYKTGLYTSPHLFDFRERIKINGNEIPEDSVIRFVHQNMDIIEQLKPSFFEITSAMAFSFFQQETVDVAVIETGLGGRLDSTNIIQPELAIITNIGFDHTEFLGNTLEKIAAEKAGIIKPRIPVVIGEKHERSTGVFTEKANEMNAPIIFAEDCLTVVSAKINDNRQHFTFDPKNNELFGQKQFSLAVDLKGDYQSKNIVTALTALAVLNRRTFQINSSTAVKGIENTAQNTGLNGRWQTLNEKPRIICDTGHNAHALKYTMKQLDGQLCDKLFFVIGITGDKDVDSIISILPQKAYYFFTQASIPRAMNAGTLAEKCRAAGLSGEIVETVDEALRKAAGKASPNDLIFIGGSSYIVAETGLFYDDLRNGKIF